MINSLVKFSDWNLSSLYATMLPRILIPPPPPSLSQEVFLVESSPRVLGQTLCWIYGLILSFLGNRQYPVNAIIAQGFILGPAVFILSTNDLPNDAICNIAVYADTIL